MIYGIDIWEGSDVPHDKINWQTLKDGGVKFAIVRLNDMSGGHHVDQQFQEHWENSKILPAHWPYFVYNPWVKGAANYDWLAAHMPSDATHVSFDVEVIYPGYSVGDYANQVEAFYNLVSKRWSCDIYTGGWFLSYIARWPSCRYWWARYPYTWYPSTSQVWTWEQVEQNMNVTAWQPGTNVPGTCQLWQISGDRLKLPGTANRVIDVNLFNGTTAELQEYIGSKAPPPPVVPDIETRLANLENRVKTLERLVL